MTIDVSESTMDEIFEAIEAGTLRVSDALAQELARSKKSQRSTLISQLRQLIDSQKREPQSGDEVEYGVIPVVGGLIEHWRGEVIGVRDDRIDLIVYGPNDYEALAANVPQGNGFGRWRWPQ